MSLRAPGTGFGSLAPRLIALAGATLLALASWSVGVVGDTAAAADARAGNATPFATDRVIVGYQRGASASRRDLAAASVAAVDVERLSPIAPDTVLLELPTGRSIASAVDVLSRRPGVAFAEPDYVVTTLATSNDPYYTDGTLWGMHGDTTSHPKAFGSGAGEAWAAGATGSASVFVGVIDEGVMHTHPDLSANIWVNADDPVNGVDDDRNGYVDDIHGWDFFHDDHRVYDGTSASPADDHGTHVAGTIGARGGNGVGVAGVNWHITVITAKFLGPDFGYTSDAIRALDYLTDLKVHGLNIVATNNSWGGGGHSQALLDAINRAGDAGILFVAAAGNTNSNNDTSPHYPSSYQCTRQADGQARGWDCVIAVASITSNGSRSSFSNHGATSVDLGRPAARSSAPCPAVAATHPTPARAWPPPTSRARSPCARAWTSPSPPGSCASGSSRRSGPRRPWLA